MNVTDPSVQQADEVPPGAVSLIALLPLMVYLVVRWWEGSTGRTGFVIWTALAMAVEFYTFNEAFAEMTVVWVAGLVTGFAVAGRAARRAVARLGGLAAIAYIGASKAAIRLFDDYARSSGLGAIVVEQAWEEPWMNLSKLGMRGASVGGVTIYPMGPWLARQAHSVVASPREARRLPFDLAGLTVIDCAVRAGPRGVGQSASIRCR